MTQGRKYTKENIVSELQRYNKEFGNIPIQKDFEKPPKGYPSRKSFATVFGTFNNALRAAGFDVHDSPEMTREHLISEIYRYIKEFGKQPFAHDMDNTKGYPAKSYYRKMFGTWNNLIKELGLKVKVSSYTDEELKNAFFRFIELKGRPPKLHDFNDNGNEYPSFWCYQNRFGSWNKTLIHYGFNPIEEGRGFHYEFENGEICKSTYEFDVSKWLRENKISYLRNVPYGDILQSYDGNKDCDYVIIHNGEFIWLEVAGFYTFKDKKSRVEKDYIERFNHKLEHLLSECNYQVFYPDDFKNRKLYEMFSFLWEIESCPWFKGEPIYQGM